MFVDGCLNDSWVRVGQSQTQLSLKQPSTKHYTENKRLTNTNPTITQTTIYDRVVRVGQSLVFCVVFCRWLFE
jgi:septum formation inhibitor MinC